MFDAKIIECAQVICKSFLHRSPLDSRYISKLNSIDLTQLAKYARAHKISAVCNAVIQNSSNELNPTIIKRFANKAQRITMRNMAYYKEMILLQNQFADENILIKPYKGVSFAKEYYQDLTYRISGDLDFAIKKEDLEKCALIMKWQGYSEEKGSINHNAIKRSRVYYLDYPWIKKMDNEKSYSVEFHLSPAHKALYIPVDFSDYLIQDKQFSKIEHALFVIIHHGAVDLWGQLMQLVDLHQIMTTLTQDEIESLVKLCEEAKVRKFLDLGFGLLEILFDITYPVERKYHKSSSLVLKISEDVLSASLSGKWSENKAMLKYHFQNRDSAIDQFRSMISLGRFGIYKTFKL